MVGRKGFFLSLETLNGYTREAMEYALLLSVLNSGMVDAFRNQLLLGLTVQAALLLLLLRGEAGLVEVL